MHEVVWLQLNAIQAILPIPKMAIQIAIHPPSNEAFCTQMFFSPSANGTSHVVQTACRFGKSSGSAGNPWPKLQDFIQATSSHYWNSFSLLNSSSIFFQIYSYPAVLGSLTLYAVRVSSIA
jgi:hypothetical protein